MPETPGRRQAAMQETRDALIAAAQAEFAEHGLDQPSLDAICARAGYTRGAFYVHFSDRDDLIAAVVEHAIGEFIDAMIGTDDRPQDLDQTVTRFAQAVEATIETAGAGGGSSAEAAKAAALPLPASVPLARLLEAVTRNARLRERFTTLLTEATSRLVDVTARGQQSGAVRADVAAEPLAAVLVMVTLGAIVAVDVGLPVDVDRARTAVLRLLGSSA